MTAHVLSYQQFYADKRRVEDLAKIYPANKAYQPQTAPEAPMLINADPADYHHGLADTGVDYITTRQMLTACAVLFAVLVALAICPWGL